MKMPSDINLGVIDLRCDPPQAVIKNADMAEDMQQDAIDCATQALEKYNIEMLGAR